MERSEKKKSARSGTDWVGVILLLFAVAALIMLNLLKSGMLSGLELESLSFQVLYPLAYACSALSMAAFAVFLLAPRVRRAAFRAAALLAALSAFCSAAYAAGWWFAVPDLMYWQDYAGIALQAVACALTALAAIRSAKNVWRLLLACACVAVSTLLFLLPPLFEPTVSVLTRALALASPMALLALGGLFTEESAEDVPEA